MQKTIMKIEDVTSCNDWALSVDVYNQETQTTTTTTLTDFGNYATDYIARNYNDREFINTSSQPSITSTTAFKNCWDNYKISNQENINRMYSGLVALYYNPIENYEGRTEQKWEYGTITDSINNGKSKTTNTYAPTSETSTNKQTTYEDTTTSGLKLNSEDTVATVQHIDTFENEQIVNGSNTRTHNDDTFTEYKHGNLGVITSAQALEYEKKIRTQSFYDWVLIDFANKYTYDISYAE